MPLGIAAVVFATLVWSLIYVAPLMIGNYTLFDLALANYLVAGPLSGLVVASRWPLVKRLRWQDWLEAARLGLIGYVGYFFTVTAAVGFAGPVVPPLMIGMVPVVLAIAGNLRQGSLPWRWLLPPLLLIGAGLLLVNVSSLIQGGAGEAPSLALGIALSLGAVALWTVFGLRNQSALARRPAIDARLWAAMTIFAGSLEMLLLFPIGLALGWSEVPRLGFAAAGAANLLWWSLALGGLTLVGGSWAWAVAARRLPIALAAQLLVLETLFATALGLSVHGRWPTPVEALGTASLVAGVVIAIRCFYRYRPLPA